MSTKIKTLVIAPSIFAPANISAPMAQKVANVYNLKGNHEVDILVGPLATRFPIISRLQEDHNLIIYMGHGKGDRICGESPICDGITTEDAYLFKDKIVVCAPACEVGQTLGPTAIYKGAKAFVGATTSMYGAWREAEHDYYADWRTYFETLYRYIMTDTVSYAVQAYKDKATEFIELYKANEDGWPNADWYINATYVNRDRLQIFGDGNARVEGLSKTQIKEVSETIEQILDWFAPPII